ncbi:Gustatory receptor 5 [Cephus cinctus]|uniref:Gustatory receptor n=1 Tax=Cephus cinctus TaxID=211228 RepID=A0A3L9LWE8_CEPCN|nr:putative gustatory receptor 28b [Cephus cinctus]RLZ02190.1 Gustatory receptor 5 [Cephus cinctus]
MQKEKISLIILRIFIFSYKVIGLATFSVRSKSFKILKDPKVDTGNHNGTDEDGSLDISMQFVYSRFGTMYNVLLTCFLLVMNYLSIPSIYSESYSNTTPLIRVIVAAQAAGGIFVMITAILVYTVKQKTALRIAGKITQMDHVLLKMDDIFWDDFSIWLFLLFLGSIALWINHLVLEVIAFDENMIPLFSVTVPSFIVYWLVLQYTFVLILIERRFRIINQALRALIPKSNLMTDCYPGIPLNLPEYILVNNSTIRSIKKLHMAYTTLCEVCLEVSEYYGVSILLAISYYFYSLVYNAYSILGPFVVSREQIKLFILLDSISWLIILVFPIAVLTWSVTKTVSEAKRTSDVVHELLHSVLHREAKIELKYFSLQLLHKNISFTAFEFFTLDFTLLRSILSATATYLIILIQFRMSDPWQSRNRNSSALSMRH